MVQVTKNNTQYVIFDSGKGYSITMHEDEPYFYASSALTHAPWYGDESWDKFPQIAGFIMGDEIHILNECGRRYVFSLVDHTWGIR